MKLWGGRFKNSSDELMEAFNSSLEIDKRLYEEDITGSIAHVNMLFSQGILSDLEHDKIIDGLESIYDDIESGALLIAGNHEDIHSFVESNLISRIGETGKKLHTARSRNDQVAVDMRLYARKMAHELLEVLDSYLEVLTEKAHNHPYLMPGYTHLQRAQVVTFKHHLLAYFEMAKRDKARLLNTLEVLDENPLGAGALAGTTHNIDRDYTTELLNFKKKKENFMDAVSDRDYQIELTNVCTMIMMHLSRLSEDMILWCSQEFGFVTMDDRYSTGSSIMPQKKNPDAPELIRGKTAVVYGAHTTLLSMMKGLPLTYNKDMQEDKVQFFTAIDTTLSCLRIMTEVIRTMTVNKENMRNAVEAGFLNATELADYLVQKNVPFRDAHRIVGEVILHCEENNSTIESLEIDTLKKFSEMIEDDVYDYIEYENILTKGIKKELL